MSESCCGRFCGPSDACFLYLPVLHAGMTWGALFDRAEGYETTVTEIRESLAERRETDHRTDAEADEN
jgi:hypothetical protein